MNYINKRKTSNNDGDPSHNNMGESPADFKSENNKSTDRNAAAFSALDRNYRNEEYTSNLTERPTEGRA